MGDVIGFMASAWNVITRAVDRFGNWIESGSLWRVLLVTLAFAVVLVNLVHWIFD